MIDLQSNREKCDANIKFVIVVKEKLHRKTTWLMDNIKLLSSGVANCWLSNVVFTKKS